MEPSRPGPGSATCTCATATTNIGKVKRVTPVRNASFKMSIQNRWIANGPHVIGSDNRKKRTGHNVGL